jgi:hypothetical protein
MSLSTTEEILKFYCERVAPALQQLVSEDHCMVAVSNLERFIYYKAAKKMDIGDITGLPLPPEDTANQSIVQRRAVTVFVPPEIFGMRFRSTAYPIFNNEDEIIGSYGIGFSMENIDVLNDVSQVIVSSAEEITATSQEIASTANILSSSMNQLMESFRSVLTQVEKTDSIIKAVSELSSHSHLLGLNAAIEAARAGEHGRGFEVVAKEIRKMAANSTQSLKEMTAILIAVKKEINLVFKQVDQLSQSTKLQAEVTGEITNAMMGLTQSADELIKLAEKI